MKEQEEIFKCEQIDRFLSGEISSEELKEQLKIFSDIEAEIGYQKAANRIVVQSQLLDLKKEMQVEMARFPYGKLKWLGYTSIIAILTVVGTLFLNKDKEEKYSGGQISETKKILFEKDEPKDIFEKPSSNTGESIKKKPIEAEESENVSFYSNPTEILKKTELEENVPTVLFEKEPFVPLKETNEEKELNKLDEEAKDSLLETETQDLPKKQEEIVESSPDKKIDHLRNDFVKKDFVFNPQIGELWQFPVEEHSPYTVRIFNRQGQEVFNRAFSNIQSWNGSDNTGQMLDVGMYVYLIKQGAYTLNGTVSIIR